MQSTKQLNNGLTDKQFRFATEFLANGGNATKAVQKVYNTEDYDTQRNIGYENLTKPHVRAFLIEHEVLAKNRIVELVQSKNERIGLDASKDILDRNLGRAKTNDDPITEGATIQIQSVNIFLARLNRANGERQEAPPVLPPAKV